MKSEAEILKLVKQDSWEKVIIEEQISEDILRKYSNEFDKNCWSDISYHQTLQEQFIEKFKDKIDWYQISIKQKLSESFIEKYQDKVYWYLISKCQQLSESFIEKHQNRIYWKQIFEYDQFSPFFIKKYRNIMFLSDILEVQNISLNFILKYKNKIYNWQDLIFKNNNITQDTIAGLWKYLTPFHKEYYISKLNKINKLVFLSKIKEKQNEK